MTNFVHVDQPTSHPGVDRFQAVARQLREARGNIDGSRGLAAVLLAAMFASVLVVADRMMSNLDEGDMLLAWAALWAIGLVAIALFANTARGLAARAATAWKAGAARRAAKRADAQFMSYAAFDPRVMHELQAAVTRYEEEFAATHPEGTPLPKRPKINEVPSLYEASRRTRMAYYF
ncbi:hypothetical protein QTI66_05810 [Variovorax sp. J22R133]|uniref:hypothetical protein n=1 Tax=Variovorax brevis TaxID=3053503 RepID=UPI00257708EA|nr:hypothetical protein [Variovorax sp. J22R133]MDM0111655.1 hypothetical protein [Variovorax sp. J22R133]